MHLRFYTHEPSPENTVFDSRVSSAKSKRVSLCFFLPFQLAPLPLLTRAPACAPSASLDPCGPQGMPRDCDPPAGSNRGSVSKRSPGPDVGAGLREWRRSCFLFGIFNGFLFFKLFPPSIDDDNVPFTTSTMNSQSTTPLMLSLYRGPLWSVQAAAFFFSLLSDWSK